MPLLESVLDRARAGLGAEMLGTASQAFDMTLEYLKTREQFGRVIGVVPGARSPRRRACSGSMELARSCVEAALQALDADADTVAELTSLSQVQGRRPSCTRCPTS